MKSRYYQMKSRYNKIKSSINETLEPNISKPEMTKSPFFHNVIGIPLIDDRENFSPQGRGPRCFRARCYKPLSY